MEEQKLPRLLGIEYDTRDGKEEVWRFFLIPDDWEAKEATLSEIARTCGIRDQADTFKLFIYETENERSGRAKIQDRWLFAAGCWESVLGKDANKLLIYRAQGKIVSFTKIPTPQFGEGKGEWELVMKEGKDEIKAVVAKNVKEQYDALLEGLKAADETEKS